MSQIRKSIARTIWVTAWMTYEENQEDGASLGNGVQIFDVAPNTPTDAEEIAERFITEFIKLNMKKLVSPLLASGLSANSDDILEALYRWFRKRMKRGESPITRDNFGHYLVMEAEHQGVGLWEFVRDHKLKIPNLECLDAWFDEEKQQFRMDGPWYDLSETQRI